MKPKPQSEEYRDFEAILGTVLKVSKVELNERLKAEKREPKAPASRVSAVPAKRS